MINKFIRNSLFALHLCSYSLSLPLYSAVPTAIVTQSIVKSSTTVDFYHSFNPAMKQQLVSQLQSANHSILVMTFTLTDSAIINLLNQKATQGLKVTVVIDKKHIPHDLHPKIEVITRSIGEGHVHHKILVVDKEVVWIGSANLSSAAYTSSQTNLMSRHVDRDMAQLIHDEADSISGKKARKEHGPLAIIKDDQIIYLCLLPHNGTPPQNVEVEINERSKQFLLEKINESKTSLRIAMMVWTYKELASAVINAHKRGVKVQVVTHSIDGMIPELKKAGIEVIYPHHVSMMHNKFMIIDDSIFVNGSPNWSLASFTWSDESFLVFDPLTLDQLKVIDDLWEHIAK